MEQLIDVFSYAYAQRALAASLLVGITCGVLGCFIVLRHMSLIGDALSHAILPGVVAGFLVAGHSVFAFFVGSVIAGLFAAILITWLQRNARTREDAAIGIVFSAMFALGIIGISQVTRQEGVHLDMKDFLFGNVLGISNMDLRLTGLITLYTLVCISAFYRFFFVTTFQPVMARTGGINANLMHYFLMLLLSFAIVASLQSVGVILVVAMLIIPASTAYLLTSRLNRMLWIAAAVGIISSVAGLLIAILLETTPGPAMTLVGAFLYGLAVFFAPKKGLFVQWVQKRRRLRETNLEDVLKAALKQKESSETDIALLSVKLQKSNSEVQAALRQLTKRGLVVVMDNKFDLTLSGKKRAYELVRAHRLWETYLSRELGLEQDQIHDQAEAFEHRLPVTFVQEVEEQLGYPKFDPHGSPIPQRARETTFLTDLRLGEKALVATEQSDDKITSGLWKLGIHPNNLIELSQTSSEHLELQTADQLIRIERALAAKVLVVRIN